VGLESIELVERTGVQEQVDAFARGELAFLVPPLDPLGSSPELRTVVELIQLLDLLFEPQV
jgi:hypothetical protein